MNKLTREQIQALQDNQINLLIMYYLTDRKNIHWVKEDGMPDFEQLVLEFWSKKIANDNALNESTYCPNAYPAEYWKDGGWQRAYNWEDSLDAQFELAEKFGILYSVVYSPNPVEDLGSFDKFLFGVAVNFDEHTKRKRTGAELLLEAIQELEEVK